eukprot:3966627-Amphidinium_carterae.1
MGVMWSRALVKWLRWSSKHKCDQLPRAHTQRHNTASQHTLLWLQTVWTSITAAAQGAPTKHDLEPLHPIHGTQMENNTTNGIQDFGYAHQYVKDKTSLLACIGPSKNLFDDAFSHD